eukprot:15444511-Alexandrium_andersonii.AAC.1
MCWRIALVEILLPEALGSDGVPEHAEIGPPSSMDRPQRGQPKSPAGPVREAGPLTGPGPEVGPGLALPCSRLRQARAD